MNNVDWAPSAIYQDIPRVSPKAGTGKEKFSMFWVFLPYMDMAAILFIGMEPFEQIVNTSLTKGPMCNLLKTGPAISKITQFYTCS